MRHVLRDQTFIRFPNLFLCGILILTGCAKPPGNSSPTNSCVGVAAPSGPGWTPNVAGVSSANHDPSVVVTKTVLNLSAPIIGIGQAAPASVETTFTIPAMGPSGYGSNGSFALEAQVTSYPGDLQGGAFPLLVYLSDGSNDYINFARAGAPSGPVGPDCASGGYYINCNTTGCIPNPKCSISQPSAFTDRSHWTDHQILSPISPQTASGYPSVNVFPTCNWAGGHSATTADPSCAFNSVPYFQAGQLKPGVYTAKYVLLSDSYATVSAGHSANLQINILQKYDNNSGGAVDLNIILVGTKNIADSHTTKGQQNLDALMTSLVGYYNQASTNIKIGKINAIEFNCQAGGDGYANVVLSKLGNMFSSASSLVAAGTESKALNIFMVSTISDDTGGIPPNLTIEGIAGGIGGPVLNGTQASGLAFSTANQLATFNPSCSSSICPVTSQDPAFWDLGVTMTHEMGHYLGLNHPSESGGTSHDMVFDTPICTALSGSGYITVNTCLNNDNNLYEATAGHRCQDVCNPATYSAAAGLFCPGVQECQFNHIMWWTSKNFKAGVGGDDNLFSTNSARIMNYSPYVQ